MLIYYSDDDGLTWTLFTDVTQFPTIICRNNMYSIINFTLGDFEGALYATWKTKDFTDIKVIDNIDDDNVLFRGYVINKKFHTGDLVFTAAGLGIKLDWSPFYENYIYAQGLVKTAPAGDTLTLWYDTDEDDVYDAGEDMGWTADQWITNQEVGFFIVDNTNDLSETTWEVQSEAISGGAAVIAGDKDSMDDEDADVYHVRETSDNWNDYSTIVMGEGGVAIPTTRKIHSITFNYKIGFKSTSKASNRALYLEAKNSDADWTRIVKLGLSYGESDYKWKSGSFQLPQSSDSELKKFLTVDGANYDEVTELRLIWRHGGDLTKTADAKLDLLTVTIKYYTTEIAPIMAQITDNGVTDVVCDGITDWDAEGVVGYDDTPVGDKFKIGENTVKIVSDIGVNADLNIEIIGQESTGGGTQILRPNGDDTTEWTNSGGGDHCDDINEVENMNGAPVDVEVIYSKTDAEECIFDMETVAMGGNNIVSKIDMYIYGKTESIVAFGWVYFYTDTTGWSEGKLFHDWHTNWDWKKLTWDNLTLTQADLDGLQIKFIVYNSFAPDKYVKVNTAYIDITYGIYDPYTRFMAREFKGTHCIDALRAVRKLEGSHWMEDYVLNRLKLVKPGSYESSDVILDSTNYDFDWEFEDLCNQVRRVDVYGNASLNIHAWAIDDSVEGSVATQIIDEGIFTYGDAQKMADNELLMLKDKRPSLKITLDGTYPQLKLGTTVNVTLERPTVAADDYKIRMIERSPRGLNGIKTIIYCGLGETDADEKIGKRIRDNALLANKALADKLISTPWTGGFINNITWTAIGGADAAVLALVNQYFGIGEANKRWKNCNPEHVDSDVSLITGGTVWSNVGGTDYFQSFGIPLDYIIGDKNLILTRIKVGLYDADDTDYVDSVGLYGFSDHDTQSANLNDDANAATNRVAAGEYIYNFTDRTVGGVYERMNIFIDIFATGAEQLDISYVQVEYYYG